MENTPEQPIFNVDAFRASFFGFLSHNVPVIGKDPNTLIGHMIQKYGTDSEFRALIESFIGGIQDFFVVDGVQTKLELVPDSLYMQENLEE